MIEFWWSNEKDKQKIPEVAWTALCRQKELGGLGFRDIGLFNQALLSKQAWRVWSRPESLLSQILKHQYFKPSYAWRVVWVSYAWRVVWVRGLLMPGGVYCGGRKLLEKGMIKSVGNGTSIKVWSDNWILDELPRPAIQPEDMEDEDLTVADLLYPNSSMWNIPMLRHYFTERDVNHITQIRLSLNREDQFSWLYSPNGEYSTKTGYKLSDLLVETSDHQNNPVRTVEQKQWSHI